MVVQPDFADGDYFLIFQDFPEFCEARLPVFPEVFRVEAGGGVEIGEGGGDLRRLFGRGDVVPDDDRLFDPEGRQGGEQRLPVAVKPVVVVVGVGVEDAVVAGGELPRVKVFGQSDRFLSVSVCRMYKRSLRSHEAGLAAHEAPLRGMKRALRPMKRSLRSHEVGLRP